MLLRVHDYMNNKHYYKGNDVIAVEKYIDNKWKDCNIIIITRHVTLITSNRDETRQDRHLCLQQENNGTTVYAITHKFIKTFEDSKICQ